MTAIPGLDAPIAVLPEVTARHLPRLAKLGLVTLRDLLYHLPRRYEDTRAVLPIRSLTPGTVQTVRARVVAVHAHKTPKRRMWLVEATLEDEGATIDAVWFNQPYLAKQLQAGQELLVSGMIKASPRGLQFQAPKFERISAMQMHVGALAAVYPETDGLTSKHLREFIESALPLLDEIADVVPPAIREREGLMAAADALREVHTPASLDSAAEARTSIAFEELFLLQLAAQRARRRRLSESGAVIPYDPEVARAFATSLPFHLTDGQRVAGHQILSDMAGTGPMNRLLQGDVGSGKTAVAALATVMTHVAGMQTAFMAPTELLARQHHVTLEKLLSSHGILPRLLVGSTPAKARREILESVAAGHDTVLVGTHALIEDEVVFAALGLVVVDEQHRFGVAQRQRLRLKAERLPNFLAMTATPIPRSLALTLYGDVNLSEIRELPPGRIPVETRVVSATKRDAAYDFVRSQVAEGRQVFVICPLVEESDKLGVKSVTAEYERLRATVFPDLRIELLHGRMPSREKDERMARFVARDVDVLVATSVVEVGVDIPNASVMIIEAAERFGLAQLHQFRGRVGRGEHQSYCLLFDSSADSDASLRLDAVARTRSGFDIAELDLSMRGAGDVAGMRQHGLPEMRAADLLDVALGQRARTAAEAWLDADPTLTSHPPLAAAMNSYRAVFDLD